MKEIQLRGNKGGIAIVDDEDFEYLNQFKWYYTYGYASRKGSSCKTIRMHREVMKVIDPKISIDHIKGDKLDNRKSMLRICTLQENQFNRGSDKKSTSIYKGVCWDKYSNKWIMKMTINGKTQGFKRFSSEIEAAKAYNELALQYHGEFAKLNII